MSTPIETNTEELQEILQTVYNLPMAGGGSAEPDLVIGMNYGATADSRALYTRTKEDFSILGGTLQNVVAKIKNGEKPRVLLKEYQKYNNISWSTGITEACSVHLVNDNDGVEYPSNNYTRVYIMFNMANRPSYDYEPGWNLAMTYSIETSELIWMIISNPIGESEFIE